MELGQDAVHGPEQALGVLSAEQRCPFPLQDGVRDLDGAEGAGRSLENLDGKTRDVARLEHILVGGLDRRRRAGIVKIFLDQANGRLNVPQGRKARVRASPGGPQRDDKPVALFEHGIETGR